jgi:hypothetical protein
MFIVAISGSLSGGHVGHQEDTGEGKSLELCAELRLEDMETV